MKQWILNWAATYGEQAIQEKAEQMGFMFFVISILFSIFVLLSPKIIPYLKTRLHIPNNILCKLLNTLYAISIIAILILSCYFKIPYSALTAISILAIVSFIPLTKLKVAILDNDSGTIKASVSQIRSFFTFILIIILTYSVVLNVINFTKLQ